MCLTNSMIKHSCLNGLENIRINKLIKIFFKLVKKNHKIKLRTFITHCLCALKLKSVLWDAKKQ